jgi:LysR family nitrogen assimilation transcriptional regulator
MSNSDPKPRTRSRSEVARRTAQDLIDSRRLLYFFHVCRLGSLTLAEQYLGVAQSAISRQLQQLESDLDVKLLQRTGRGVAMTELGRLLFERAEAMLEAMAETRVQLDFARRRPAIQVSIAASTSFMSLFMPEVTRRFIEAFPDATLRAIEASSGQVFEMLASGRVDLAVVIHAHNSQKLMLKKLITEPLVVICSPGNPAAKRKVITPEELCELSLVLPVNPYGSRAIIEKYLTDAGLEARPRLEIDSLALSKAAVKLHDLCTVLPTSTCSDELARGELAAVRLSPPISRTLHVASLRNKPLSVAAKTLTSLLAEEVRARAPKQAD